MEKIAISAAEKKPLKLEFVGQEVEVLQYISPINESIWIDNYIDSYFKDGNHSQNYLEAEWGLMLAVVNEMTNIRIIEETDNVGLEELITSGLWDKIKSVIINYNDFKKDLESVVSYQREQNALDKSVGTVLGNVANKVTQLMDKIMEMDISPEGTAKLVEQFKTEVAKFDTTFGATPSRSRKPRKTANKS